MPRFRISYEVDAPDKNHIPTPPVDARISNIKTSSIRGPRGKNRKWHVYAGRIRFSGPHTKKDAAEIVVLLRKKNPKENWLMLEV